jgi:hypothetical protein
MLYKAINGKNMILSGTQDWNGDERNIPKIIPNSIFKAYGGHIVWLSPQSEWWSNQNFNLERKYNKSCWPPDPFLIYGNYVIEERRAGYLRIRGPKSPVSGMQMTKEIFLDDKGAVTLTVRAKNIRKNSVRCGIWSNTRISGDARTYVPIKYSQPLKIENLIWKSQYKALISYDVKDGFLFLLNEKPIPTGKVSMQNKVFVDPVESIIASFFGKYLFLKRTKLIERDKIHKNHRRIEICNQVARNPALSFTELEFHGEYKEVKPGEDIIFTETWEIIDYSGDNSRESHIKFLKKHGIKNEGNDGSSIIELEN